jgi:hypothetical protein
MVQIRHIPATGKATLIALRMIYGAMLVSIPLYGLAIELTPVHISTPLNPLVPVALGFVVAANLAAGQTIRSRKLVPAFEKLRANPDDPAALLLWRTGAVISVCLAESAAVFGVVTYFVGGSLRQVAPFLVMGAIAILFWWPRKP